MSHVQLRDVFEIVAVGDRAAEPQMQFHEEVRAHRQGQDDSKPNIYVAKWMRKPGDREPEDEDMPTNGKNSESHEPTSSRPESTLKPARIAAVPQPPTVRPGIDTRKRVDEPAETHPRIPGASFGRFQGLG
jgi:hypothetical protein